MEEKCYKINCDVLSLDFNQAFDKLSEIGDVLFYSQCIYLWLKPDFSKKELVKYIKKIMKISEFFCEPVFLDSVKEQTSILSSWFIEHYSKDQEKELEKQRQADLNKMLENIKRATEELEKITKK